MVKLWECRVVVSCELRDDSSTEFWPRCEWTQLEAMALSKLMMLLLLALISCSCMIRGCGAGRPLSIRNTFTPFQYSKFQKSFFVAWSESNVAAVDGGHTLQLSLDRQSGTAVSSTSKYLYGYFRASIKLHSGNSAGTVTAFYLSSQGHNHDEVDFEFLGNVTGEPYVLQTNVYANGIGNREQRIFLWFDPRSEFHTYSVIWNHKSISMYVDDMLIRVFQNNEAHGQPYLSKQPMGVYSSIFDASNWATRGGLDKIDFNNAPFHAHYANFTMDSCVVNETVTTSVADPCVAPTSTEWWNAEWFQSIPANRVGQMQWVNHNFMVYDYCTDKERFPVAPFECAAPIV